MTKRMVHVSSPHPPPESAARTSPYSIMAWFTLPALALVAATNLQWLLNPKTVAVRAQDVPAQAQVINQASWNGMPPWPHLS